MNDNSNYLFGIGVGMILTSGINNKFEKNIKN